MTERADGDRALTLESLRSLATELDAAEMSLAALTPETEKQRLLQEGAMRRQAIGMAVADIRAALVPANMWANSFGAMRNNVLNRVGASTHQVSTGASKVAAPILNGALDVLNKPAVRKNVVNVLALWRAGTTIWSIYQARKKHH